MKKIEIVILLLAINFVISKAEPPKCLTDASTYVRLEGVERPDSVDWWFIEQLQPNSALYTDSTLKAQEVEIINRLHPYDVRSRQSGTESSPAFNTYLQTKNTNFNSITYNDQKGIPAEPGHNSAHSKGVFIWNEDGGIHIIHSIPKSPVFEKEHKLGGKFFLYNGKENSQLAQHIICIKLSAQDLSIIPKYLIYSNTNIMTINNVPIPNTGKPLNVFDCGDLQQVGDNRLQCESDMDQTQFDGVNTFAEMDKLIERNIPAPQYPKLELGKFKIIANKVTNKPFTSEAGFTDVHYSMILNSGEGSYYIQTTNEFLKLNTIGNEDTMKLQTKYTILWSYIAGTVYPIYNDMEWISQTMTKFTLNKLSAIFTPIKNIALVDRFVSPVAKNINTNRDHSKLLYGSSKDGKNQLFCFGDLNWNKVQEGRGGGAYCRKDMGYLVDYFSRSVSYIRDPDKFSTEKSYILKSASVTTINFGDVLKEIQTQGIKRSLFYAITLHRPTDLRYSLPVILQSDYEKAIMPLFVQLESNDVDISFKEAMSFDIYASIEQKVLVCKSNQVCSMYNSYKFPLFNVKPTGKKEIGKKKEDIITFSIGSPIYNEIDTFFKSILFYVDVAKVIQEEPNEQLTNELPLLRFFPDDRAIKKLRFTFPINNKKIEEICYDGMVIDTYLIAASPKCIDNFIFCLFISKGYKINTAKGLFNYVNSIKDEYDFDFDVTKFCNIDKNTIDNQKKHFSSSSSSSFDSLLNDLTDQLAKIDL